MWKFSLLIYYAVLFGEFVSAEHGDEYGRAAHLCRFRGRLPISDAHHLAGT